jgi:hypothetical protein
VSGETDDRPSGWTTDTLHEHLQQQLDDSRRLLDERYATQTKALDAAFAAADKAVQTALLSAEKAVAKAETAAERRFEAVNEFRGQLADQATTFMPRTEADVRLTAMDEKVSRNTEDIASLQGRALALAGIGALTGGALVAIISRAIGG